LNAKKYCKGQVVFKLPMQGFGLHGITMALVFGFVEMVQVCWYTLVICWEGITTISVVQRVAAAVCVSLLLDENQTGGN
jgi:hypothetical protein